MPTKLFRPKVVEAEFLPEPCANGVGPRSRSCLPGNEFIVPERLRMLVPDGRVIGGDERAERAELEEPRRPSFGGAMEYIVVGESPCPSTAGTGGGRSIEEYRCFGELELAVEAGFGGETRIGSGKSGSGFLRFSLKKDDLRLPASSIIGLFSPEVRMGVEDSE